MEVAGRHTQAVWLKRGTGGKTRAWQKHVLARENVEIHTPLAIYRREGKREGKLQPTCGTVRHVV